MASSTISDQQPLPMITSHNRLNETKFCHKITFHKLSRRKTQIQSSISTSPAKCELKYFLRLELDTFLKLEIQFVSSKPNTFIEVTTSVLDQNGTKHLPDVNYYCLVTEGKRYNIFFKSRNDVMDATKGLLPDDMLTFYCEFTFTVEVSEDRFEFASDQLADIFDQNSRINDDLGRLLTDGKLTDVQIVVGGKQFRAHKCILAARSPVFSAMFEHDTKEKQENRVEITDVQPEVFDEVLRFTYTGKMESLDKFGAELLVVADKYQLDSLKALCEATLCDQLSSKTVADLIVLADLYNAPKLKQSALEYFRKNTLESIESMFETNQTEELVKAFRDLTCGDYQNGSSNKD